MTEWFQPTITLEDLKEANKMLKKELEIAKLEAENRELREEIYRLRNPYNPWTMTYIQPYTTKQWDNITLCNNQQ